MKSYCRKFLSSQRAFTLIELLIVIAIILILIAIALPNFLEAQIRARVTKARAELRSIQIAYESYRAESTLYPRGCIPDMPSVDCLHNWGFVNYGGVIKNGRSNGYITTPIQYMKTIPQDLFAVNYTNVTSPIPEGHPWMRYRTTRRIVWNRDDNTRAWNAATEQASNWTGGFDLYEPAKFKNKQYLLNSLGPDKDEDLLPYYAFSGPYRKNCGNAFYSPTNGTVSSGDLAIMGP